jgi:hypothetical protein
MDAARAIGEDARRLADAQREVNDLRSALPSRGNEN